MYSRICNLWGQGRLKQGCIFFWDFWFFSLPLIRSFVSFPFTKTGSEGRKGNGILRKNIHPCWEKYYLFSQFLDGKVFFRFFFLRFFKISKAWVCQVWYLSRMGCVTFQLQWNMLFSTHCLYINDQTRLESLVWNDITLQLNIPLLIRWKTGLF